MITFKSIRPLSMHETSFPLYATFSPGAGNIVAALTVSGVISDKEFRQAIEKVTQRHLTLRSTYAASYLQGKPTYHWLLTDQSPSVKTVLLTEDGDIEKSAHQEMERLLNEGFPEGSPLCRFVLLSAGNTHKIFACVNHAAMDGSSTINVLRLISERLAKPDSQSSGEIVPISPALWSFMPKAIKGAWGIFRCFAVFKMLIRLQKQADAGVSFPVEIPAPAAEHRCMVAMRQLNVEESNAVVALSKQNNVSVHGLLGAALTCAFADQLREVKGAEFCTKNSSLKIPIVSTMDLRRRITPPIEGDVLGCLSSGATHSVRCDLSGKPLFKSEYLDLGREVDATLNREISRHQHWKLLRIYQLLGIAGMKKVFKDSSEKPMSMPISLANLGKLEFPSTGVFQVLKFEAAPAFHVSGPAVNVQCNRVNNQMALSFSSALPQMSRTTLEKFSDNVIQHLTQMVL